LAQKKQIRLKKTKPKKDKKQILIKIIVKKIFTDAQTSAFNGLFSYLSKITPYLESVGEHNFVPLDFYNNLVEKLNRPRKPDVLELSFPIRFVDLEKNNGINEFFACFNYFDESFKV